MLEPQVGNSIKILPRRAFYSVRLERACHCLSIGFIMAFPAHSTAMINAMTRSPVIAGKLSGEQAC
jgi:hypothetical protein